MKRCCPHWASRAVRPSRDACRSREGCSSNPSRRPGRRTFLESLKRRCTGQTTAVSRFGLRARQTSIGWLRLPAAQAPSTSKDRDMTKGRDTMPCSLRIPVEIGWKFAIAARAQSEADEAKARKVVDLGFFLGSLRTGPLYKEYRTVSNGLRTHLSSILVRGDRHAGLRQPRHAQRFRVTRSLAAATFGRSRLTIPHPSRGR